MKVAGIILAGGRGTRFKSQGVNKTAAKLQGKPLVVYGLELLADVTDRIVVVVGAYAESVKEAIGDRAGVSYATQSEPLGTGHALNTAIEKIVADGDKPDAVIVGYADHMMFYRPETVRSMIDQMTRENAQVVLLTTQFDDPDTLRWGRIIRSENGEVSRIVEQKEATDEEKAVTEVNPGFYCFNFDFLEKNRFKLEKSVISGEYYITDYIQIAVDLGLKVSPYLIPFEEVGYGVNTQEELETDEEFFRQEV